MSAECSHLTHERNKPPFETSGTSKFAERSKQVMLILRTTPHTRRACDAIVMLLSSAATE